MNWSLQLQNEGGNSQGESAASFAATARRRRRRRRRPRPESDEMVHGKLEVLLICARGLEDTDFLNNMDPYVILTCRSQEQKSSVAKGAGSEPEWNETFVFTVSDDTPQPQLVVKIMDSDALTEDDFVGEATIPLEPVLQEGSLPPEVHRVVKEEEYCGEIKLALTFTPVETCRPDNEDGAYSSCWN